MEAGAKRLNKQVVGDATVAAAGQMALTAPRDCLKCGKLCECLPAARDPSLKSLSCGCLQALARWVIRQPPRNVCPIGGQECPPPMPVHESVSPLLNCRRTMTMAAIQSLYLVDAHSLIFQVFHALPEMTSPSGLPTNALFGFTRDLLFLRTEKRPEYLVCVFDASGPTFRDQLYAEYKAHRGPMPDDLQLQIPLMHRLL